MAPQLSPEDRASILLLKGLGWNNAQIATKLKCHPSTIGRTLERLAQNGGDVHYVTPGRGRRTVFTSHDLRRMKYLVVSGSARDGADVFKQLEKPVAPRTIRRKLDEIGYFGRVRRKVPLLMKHTIRQRKAWAKQMRRKPFSFWRRVIFSDESKYMLFGSDGKKYCRRRPGEEFLPRNVTKTLKHGGGKVMVWGCVTWDGVGELYRIDGILEKFQYVRILEGPLTSSILEKKMDPLRVIFQQDGDSKHTAKITKKWLRAQKIEVLPWPGYSPDMNIIEHVWDVLEKALRQRKPLPTSENTLWIALEQEWYRIPVETIRNLYRSIPARVKALHKAKGLHTRY